MSNATTKKIVFTGISFGAKNVYCYTNENDGFCYNTYRVEDFYCNPFLNRKGLSPQRFRPDREHC